MNQKQVGIVTIIISIVLVLLIFGAKAKEDYYISQLVKEDGTCVLDDGYCLHEDRSYTLYIAGGIIAGALAILGIYLIFFDKTQKTLAENQAKIASALEQSSKKDEFNAFISSFNEDEKSILKAIHEQEGIQQSTLRYKIGLSQAAASILVAAVEKRGIIAKKVDGKTNKLFLRKKF